MKLFYSKLEFLLSLKDSTDIDFDKTTNCSGWGFVTKDGRSFFGRTFTQYIEAMNEMLGTKFDTVYSVRLGSMLKVFYTEQPSDTNIAFVEDIKDAAIVVTDTIVDEVEIIPEQPENITDKYNLDWDMINSLENKKYDKIKLEKYIFEKTGINLNRRFTIENMIVQLKEELLKS